MSLLDQPRLSCADAARKCGVHINTIHRWRLMGNKGKKLPCVRIGGRIFVLVADLEAWLDYATDDASRNRGEDYAIRAEAANAKCAAVGL